MAGQIWTSWTAYNPNFGYENAVIFFPNVIVGNPNLTYENGVQKIVSLSYTGKRF